MLVPIYLVSKLKTVKIIKIHLQVCGSPVMINNNDTLVNPVHYSLTIIKGNANTSFLGG